MDDVPYTGDLDLDAVNTRDDLAERLRQVHVLADEPSLRRLEVLTRHTDSPLSRTAVSEMLRGRRFPHKKQMLAFLEACGVKDNTVAWQRAWERVKQHASRVAGEAGNEERAERARGERMTAAASASADSAGKAEHREQAREPRPGVSVVSPEELRVFGAELTQALRMRRKTIEQAAAELAVPQANVVLWTEGQELPSESQARSLDEYLTTRRAIQKRVTELRSGPDRPSPGHAVPLSDPSAPTLLQTFQNVAAALRGCLARDADGRPTGWAHDLSERPAKAAAVSTAYGIRTMLLLEDSLAADLIPVAESLREMEFSGGGYAGREQAAPRPEATAAVLNALCRITATDGFDAHIAQMERDLGDFENYRPFILTIMLEASLLLKSAPRLVETLNDNLLATRRPYGDLLLWPEKAEPFRSAPAPSVAHTARAVRVLAGVQTIRPAGPVREALEQAVAWLIGQPDLHNASEKIERELKDRPEVVHVRHFTAAWVVKALVSAGVPTSHPAVSNAVAQIWDSYDGTTAALWAWENGDQPIWMTFDAIEALRLANLAIPALPAWSPPQ